MAKQLERIRLYIVGNPLPDGSWSVQTNALLTIGLDEYPDFSTTKDVPILLTTSEEIVIKNFVKNVVLPQAEGAK